MMDNQEIRKMPSPPEGETTPFPPRKPLFARKGFARLLDIERAILRQHEPKTSTLLKETLDSMRAETITLGEIIAALNGRSFGILMMLFALPGCIPGPPVSILGVPLVLFACQVMLGYNNPWLPKKLADLPLQRKHVAAVINTASPSLERLEKLCKPRLEFLDHRIADRLIGFIIVILGLTMALPIPGTNILPALSIAILSLGMLERDGLVILAGIVVGSFAVSLALTALHIIFAVTNSFLEKIIA